MQKHTDSANTPSDQTIPNEWPGAFGLYAYSKNAVMTVLGTILGLVGLSILVSLPTLFVEQNSTTYYLLSIVTNLMGVWFSAALIVASIKGVQKQSVSLNEALGKGGALFLSFFILTLLTSLLLLGSLLLFVIPFFIILPRISLAPYFLIHKKLDPVASLQQSWEAMRGHAGKFWGILGVNLLIGLLIVTIIGIPFGLYFAVMYYAANVVLYFWIIGNQSKTPDASAIISRR